MAIVHLQLATPETEKLAGCTKPEGQGARECWLADDD
jgi:hypothetical protein